MAVPQAYPSQAGRWTAALVLALCLLPAPAAPARAADPAEPPPAGSCPLTAPSHTARLLTPEVEGRVGEPAYLLLELIPPHVPPGFYVSSLAEVSEAPAGATGKRRPDILPGFPRIRFTAAAPGVYRLDLRVNLIAKSSCGGVKAAPLLETTALVRVAP